MVEGAVTEAVIALGEDAADEQGDAAGREVNCSCGSCGLVEPGRRTESSRVGLVVNDAGFAVGVSVGGMGGSEWFRVGVALLRRT